VLAERFAHNLLSGPPARSAAAVAERLLAVQGQDARGFRLAVRARTRGLVAADVDAALDDGSLLVSWLNRGTLHLVRAEDYWLLQPLTTPQLVTGNARRLAQEGVPPAAAERGVRAVVAALDADGPLTRAVLRERVAAADVRVEGQALVHVLFLAALRGLVVRGPTAGGSTAPAPEQAFVLVRDWLGPPPPSLDRDTALAELARRYLAGHGPASDRDLAKWAGLPLGDARRGLAALRLVDRGSGLVSLRRAPRPPPALPAPRLLGAFEPFLLGWTSREQVVGAADTTVAVNGLFRPFALVGGAAAGTWALERGRVALAPFRPLSASDAAALEADAGDVERFLRPARAASP
jgi:hypothetical protein